MAATFVAGKNIMHPQHSIFFKGQTGFSCTTAEVGGGRFGVLCTPGAFDPRGVTFLPVDLSDPENPAFPQASFEKLGEDTPEDMWLSSIFAHPTWEGRMIILNQDRLFGWEEQGQKFVGLTGKQASRVRTKPGVMIPAKYVLMECWKHF